MITLTKMIIAINKKVFRKSVNTCAKLKHAAKNEKIHLFFENEHTRFSESKQKIRTQRAIIEKIKQN